MNEKQQQLSLDNSQSVTSSINATPSSSPNNKLAATIQGSTPISYSSGTQLPASPSTEVLHLKQLLAEGRQTCLNLQRQHSQDKTEMAKIQGSLQALLQIQNHLSTENKSVAETLASVNEEKDAYKQESMKLGGELVNTQQELEGLMILLAQFKEKAVIKVTELTETMEAGCELHTTLVELASDLQDCEDLNTLKIFDDILEAFCKYFDGLDNKENEFEEQQRGLRESLKRAQNETECKTRDIELLQRKMMDVCGQVEILEEELEKQRKVLTEKEEELSTCRREIEELQEEQMNRSNESVHIDYIKDIDAKYQVSRVQFVHVHVH